MIPGASSLGSRYGELTMPVAIIAGALDRLIDTDSQSARLGEDIAHSTFRSVPGAGHMVHQTATDEVMAAIEEAVKAADAGGKRKMPPAA